MPLSPAQPVKSTSRIFLSVLRPFISPSKLFMSVFKVNVRCHLCLQFHEVFDILFGAGQGGLEVRGHGAGPAVPVDLHNGGGGGHGRDHPAGPQPLR